MKNILIVVFKYVLLFIFTATVIDKIYNYDTFTTKLYSSPLIDEGIVTLIALFTIFSESLICYLLLSNKLEKFGFLLSSVCFCFFTVYISCLYFVFKDTRPCACGFLFEWMTYPVHIAVNSILFILCFFTYTRYTDSTIPEAPILTTS